MILSKISIPLILLTSSFNLGALESNFFCQSCELSKELLIEKREDKSLDMTWNFGEDSYLRFKSTHNEVFFEICVGTLPNQYDGFIDKIKDQLIKKNESQYAFSYQLTGNGKEIINASVEKIEHEKSDAGPYTLTERRILSATSPMQINQQVLASVIKEKKCLFYTGAGLSLASDVPAMNELFELLGLDEGENFMFSLEKAIHSPRKFAEKIRYFHDKCVYSAPTQAHLALKDLSLHKNTRLITENLDCLHEASGIVPYRVNPLEIRNDTQYDLSQFDYIICVGLSFDDRGLLGWYKEQNPQGRILAIDLQAPSYLGNEDFWIKGDLQEVLSELHREIFEIKTY